MDITSDIVDMEAQGQQMKSTQNRLSRITLYWSQKKGAKSRLRGIKQKKIQIIPLNLDLDLSFRISEA